jgi:histidine triad (HIT) family protein
MNDCLFCKIVRGEIPAKKVYEDEYVLAFHDIHPQAPVHLLLIPKQHIDSLLSLTAQDEKIMGKLLVLAPQLARQQGLEQGFKTTINTGARGGQEIYHLHLHVYGSPR